MENDMKGRDRRSGEKGFPTCVALQCVAAGRWFYGNGDYTAVEFVGNRSRQSSVDISDTVDFLDMPQPILTIGVEAEPQVVDVGVLHVAVRVHVLEHLGVRFVLAELATCGTRSTRNILFKSDGFC